MKLNCDVAELLHAPHYSSANRMSSVNSTEKQSMAKSTAATAAKKDPFGQIDGEIAHEAAAAEAVDAMVLSDDQPVAVPGSSDAANDQSIHPAHTPEVLTAIGAVTQEIDDAVAVIEQGAEQLELKDVKADDNGRPKIKKKTPHTPTGCKGCAASACRGRAFVAA